MVGTGDGHNIVLPMGFGGGLSMLYTHKCGSPRYWC